jgi:hypothetical protein
MTLLEIRTKFIELSGRYDLITDTESYQDAGADFLILSGQRWLDRTFEVLKSSANYYATLSQGSWYVLVPECRIIRGVWISYSNGVVGMLKQLSLERMRHCFSQVTTSDSCPHFYAPCSIRTQPEVAGQLTVPPSTIVMEDNFPYNAVVFDVPVGEQVSAQVVGYFNNAQLVNDTDQNFWSVEHSWILVLAAMRAMEIAQRNREGVADWETAIRSEMLGLEYDHVDQISFPIKQMEG